MADQIVIDRKQVAIAAAIDVVSVVAFVALGLKSHHEDGSFLRQLVKVAAPFLIALVIGWLAARAWKAPRAVATGVVIWIVTVAGGMLLRHFAFDDSTALAFIIVASAFTLLFLVGWRFVAEWLAERRAGRTT